MTHQRTWELVSVATHVMNDVSAEDISQRQIMFALQQSARTLHEYFNVLGTVYPKRRIIPEGQRTPEPRTE